MAGHRYHNHSFYRRLNNLTPEEMHFYRTCNIRLLYSKYIEPLINYFNHGRNAF